MFSRLSWRGRTAATLVGLAATLAAACGSSGPAVTKTTATWAEGQGAAPNYIFPLASLKYFSVANLSQFQYLMYRPLYWFGDNGQVKLNDSLSLAQEPVYSADGKTVTIKLKDYKWSDGVPVTAQDVEFWLNLLIANKSNWAGYSPGEWPDNLASFTVDNSKQLTLHLTQAYGSYFFTYNELSQISPIPQHLWDKTSDTDTVKPEGQGAADDTTSGAVAVYKYLDGQSGMLSTYATNPLWQVVDGPWKLSKFDTTGACTFVPNTNYSGPIKPTLKSFTEIPYTKDTAEFDQLKGGTTGSNAIDYGYIPLSSATKGQINSVTSLGYSVQPWVGWQITYFPENFTNPTSGPIFKQLYFRQAMQYLVNQPLYVSKAQNANGYPTYGPVPVYPANNFADSFEKSNPYPFNPTKAVTLLQSHGWTVNPGGVSTCSSPGSGSNQCGAGVPAGATASFHLEYLSGTAYLDAEMAQFKTDFSKAGIEINLSTAPFDTVIGNATPCTPGTSCKWDMEFWGGGWIYSPDYYPTGDEIFSTGAGSNSGGYSDPTNDSLTLATEKSNSVQALYTYENYLAKQLPVVWMPVPDAQVSAINSHLTGVLPQDPLLQLYPENWRWT